MDELIMVVSQPIDHFGRFICDLIAREIPEHEERHVPVTLEKSSNPSTVGAKRHKRLSLLNFIKIAFGFMPENAN